MEQDFLKFNNIIIVISIMLLIGCNMKPDSNKINYGDGGRKQRVVEKDSKGRIAKTYDGYVYRLFDSLGRMIEYFGNFKQTDDNSNFHTFIHYQDSLILIKEYFLEDENKLCKITDTMDCYIRKYFYEDDRLVKFEFYNPKKDKNGKIIGYKLVDSDNNPSINPYLGKIPDYLK